MKLPGPDRCCGCSACASVCKVGAITMLFDEEGFLQPNVDSGKCILCKKCEQVCPVINVHHTAQPHCYIAKSIHEDILESSSSGGVFSELAIPILKAGGCVVGCVMDVPQKKAMHMLVEDAKALSQMRGSKYIQSELGDVFALAKQQLEQGRKLLFSGTPCQIDGFKRYLGHESENLLCVEVACHGVGSTKIFQQFLEELEKDHSAKVTDVRFRDKQSSASSGSCFTLTFEGGVNNRFVAGSYDNAYGKAFMDRLCLRRACDYCPSKAGCSGADITIGDYWGGRQFHPNFEQDKGASVVVVWTSKGGCAFGECGVIAEESRWEWATKFNPSLFQSGASDVKKRHSFFKISRIEGVSHAVEVLCRKSMQQRLMASIIKLLYKFKSLLLAGD